MNKKIFSFMLAGLMLFGASACAKGDNEEAKLISPASVSISLTIGEKQLIADGDMVMDLEVAPIIINDRTMVPMRDIFTVLGANIQWDDETKTVYALKNGVMIVIQIGKDIMFVNNTRVELDAPAVIVDDRTMVPLRAIAQAYGSTVNYDDETKTVTIVK